LWRKPGLYDQGVEIPAETVERTLTDLHAKGLRKIHFSGGEVLVLKSFPRLVEFARGLGLQVNLTTNGTLLDKDVAKFLVEARTHSVTVSIDSPNPRQHDEMRGRDGAWKLSMRGIDNLVKRKQKKGRGPVVAVNTIVTRKNAEGLDELHDLLVERGVSRWRLLPVDSDDKKHRPTEEQWKNIAERWERWRPILTRLPIDWTSIKSAAKAGKGKYAGRFYKDRVCFAPWFNLFIDADGKAYPCCMGKHNMRPYGGVHDSSTQELLASRTRTETLCTMASGHIYPICEYCDDFLEENMAFWELYAKEDRK